MFMYVFVGPHVILFVLVAMQVLRICQLHGAVLLYFPYAVVNPSTRVKQQGRRGIYCCSYSRFDT
jgi:hypothetical protein